MNMNKSLLRPSAPSVWGDIHGCISDQKDLMAMLSDAGALTQEQTDLINQVAFKANSADVEQALSQKADIQALEGKADKTDIPSIEGLATETELQSVYSELNNKIGDIETLTEEILAV